MRGAPAFTLVEVVVAVGVFAVTVVAVLGLLGPVGRSVAGVSDQDKAAQLGDAIQSELVRIRDSSGGGAAGLDKIALLIGNEKPLALVGSSDGTRVTHETEAVDSAASTDPLALPKKNRFFLIEIQLQPTFTYTGGSGANRSAFLAVSAAVKWPYTLGDGSKADLTQASVLLLNFAIPP